MESSIEQKFIFPVGYEQFHKRQVYNFQLNRPYSFGYARYKDLKEAGQIIKSFSDWKREMIRQAEKALSEQRIINAAFYYRAAEFYTKATDQDKNILYNTFFELFNKGIGKENIERYKIPYSHSFLSGIRITPKRPAKGVIVLHGGFDSFIEEFYSMMKYLSMHGFEVIGFEGPGQGATLRNYDIPITYKWEKPVKSVLDYFQLDDVTIIGLSMGGWLCLRAASYEPRIKRVIASGHAIDYMKTMPAFFYHLHLWFFKHGRGFMNKMATLKFENKEGMASWMVDHMKFITKKSQPLDALELYLELNDKNIHSENVTQDVLLLTGQNDHFIPLKMHQLQIDALINAHSVTEKVFTAKEHAQNHCQIGNVRLALDTMIKWMQERVLE